MTAEGLKVSEREKEREGRRKIEKGEGTGS